jgi:Holliday junction resolvase RusA-like endonuclease
MTQKPDDSASEQGLQAISQIIFGEPASKANSRKVVRIGGMSRLIKSSKALKYSDMFKQQCRQLGTLMTGDLRVTMWIYYASRRPDLDESLILDLMQGLIYENDRQVKEKHIYWGLDPERPRTEIIVECIPSVSPKEKPRTGRGKKREATAKAVQIGEPVPPV